MKRHSKLTASAALILLTVLLASCVTDSGNTVSGNSAEPSSAVSAVESDPPESAEPSEESSEKSSEEPSEESREVIEITDKHDGRYLTPISTGKPYKASKAASVTYPDDGTKLTDSVFASDNFSYSNPIYCGYNASYLTVTIDLGADSPAAYGFEASFLSMTEAGVSPPKTVNVGVSDDNTAWTDLGQCAIEAHVEGTSKKAYLYTDTAESHRYVRFTFTHSSAWLFLEELSVFADIPYEETEEGKKMLDKYNSDNGFPETRTAGTAAISTGKKVDLANGSYAVSTFCDCTVTSAGFDDRIENKLSLLTDGDDIGPAITEKVWVGVKADDGATVTVDLGAVNETVYSFRLSCIGGTDGIVLPDYVDIYAGSEKDSLSLVGRAYAPLSKRTYNTYTVSLPECVNARYVSFVLPAVKDAFYRFDEAAVYGNCNANGKRNYYGDFEVTETPVSYWDKNAADYGTEQNLVLGRDCMIFSGSDVSGYASRNPRTPWLVTDGEKSDSLDCYNGKWLQNNGGINRAYVIDLGHTSAVASFSADFLYNIAWGIYLPDTVTFSVSEDGVNWYVVKDFTGTVTGRDQSSVKYEVVFAKAYLARYIKLFFNVQGHVFIDELTVNGRKDITGAVSAASEGIAAYTGTANGGHVTKTDESSGYAVPDPELLGGVNDVLLVYHNTSRTVDEEMLTPYVGYIDKEGNMTDTMWDGFLFLPTTGALPSGARPDGGNTVKQDWESVFNSLVTEGQNFDALNKTVEKVGNKLGIDNYKVKIYVSIINISPDVTDFGDVDGDGVSENMSIPADRRKVVEWYMGKIEKALASGKYPRLELYGYYWFSEQCSGKYEQIVKETAETVHAAGEQFFWIPWFCAGGYDKWREFGFDVACMQPNYAFNVGIPESRLTVNAELTRANGLCYEMESWSKAFKDDVFLRKYMNYMKHGVTEGYSKAINMYYQDVDFFYRAFISDTAKIRLLYDYQHSYMKDTLEVTPETPPCLSFKAKKDTAFTSSLAVTASDIRNYKIVLSPSHGSLTVSPDGSFTYYPDKGYIGNDSFVYCIDEYLADSAPATVEIVVE